MGLPGQRRSKSYKRKRSIHYRLKRIKLFKCSKCKKPVLAHHVCSFCGSYAGKQILKVKAERGKKSKKGTK